MARDDNGLAAFKQRLAKLPKSARDKTNKAIQQNAREWVSLARKLAPKDPADGTPLHDSIRHYESDTGGQIVRAGGETTTRDGYDYALAQEFGTAEQGGQSFFWPSYRLLKKQMVSRQKRAMNKAIKEI